MKKLFLLPLLVLGLVAAAPAVADDYAASIAPTGFPPLISINNGDTVTWTNHDAANRQLVSDDGTWKSPVLKPGDSWSHIFVKGGTFKYHGAFKNDQHGTVEVATTRVVLMRQSAKTVQIFRTVKLQGSVSNKGSTGEEVSIEAMPAGITTFHEVARTTTQNGVWKVQVKPRRITVYRAVWQNVPSSRARCEGEAVRPPQAGRAAPALRERSRRRLARAPLRAAAALQQADPPLALVPVGQADPPDREDRLVRLVRDDSALTSRTASSCARC